MIDPAWQWVFKAVGAIIGYQIGYRLMGVWRRHKGLE